MKAEKAKRKSIPVPVLLGIFIILAVGYLLLMYEVARHQHYTWIDFSVKNQPLTYSAASGSECYEIPLQIHNKSNLYMNSALGGGYYLTYHLYDETQTLVSYENRRTELPHGIFADDHTKMNLLVDPLPVGTYYIVPDMVQEGVAYFTDGDTRQVFIELVVTE